MYTSTYAALAPVMRSATLSVRVDVVAKKRLERLAKNTGRSRSFLAAEAINEYLDVNEWQITGINRRSLLSTVSPGLRMGGSRSGSHRGVAIRSAQSRADDDSGLVARSD